MQHFTQCFERGSSSSWIEKKVICDKDRTKRNNNSHRKHRKQPFSFQLMLIYIYQALRMKSIKTRNSVEKTHSHTNFLSWERLQNQKKSRTRFWLHFHHFYQGQDFLWFCKMHKSLQAFLSLTQIISVHLVLLISNSKIEFMQCYLSCYRKSWKNSFKKF